MNDPSAQFVKANRKRQLQKEGNVDYEKLVDIQQRGNSEAAQEQRRRAGGK